jgi:hypothetical protein
MENFKSDDEKETFILNNFKVIGVVGCSRVEGKPSHDIPKYMKDAGYKIIPINPNADTIFGEKSYPDLNSVPFKIDIVDVFRPADETLKIAEDAFKIGAKVVWLQEGIVNEDTENYCQKHELLFVMNRCIMKEYIRLIEKIT